MQVTNIVRWDLIAKVIVFFRVFRLPRLFEDDTYRSSHQEK